MVYKMDLFAKIIYGYRPLIILVKKLHLRCSHDFEYLSADRKPLLPIH